jgi:hypothetical protein
VAVQRLEIPALFLGFPLMVAASFDMMMRTGGRIRALPPALTTGIVLEARHVMAARHLSFFTEGFSARFWANVRIGPRCWPWIGCLRSDGYGVVGCGARSCRAHRLAYEMTFGPIPDGLHVLHDCDNRACCRPDHLTLGTNLDNITDMIAKGRQHRGERSPGAKLTETAVRLVRARHAAGVALDVIAVEFGISKANASLIINRRTWWHVEK